jgi:hypothetical protein
MKIVLDFGAFMASNYCYFNKLPFSLLVAEAS